MKRIRLPALAALAVLASAPACSKKDAAKNGNSESTTLTSTGSQGGAANPSPAAKAPEPQTAKTNKLWALAPAGTVLGVVVQPGAAAEVQSMFLGVLKTVETQPAGLALLKSFHADVSAAPVNVLDPESLRAAGIDLSGGGALFFVKKKEVYLVLPVSDRLALRKASHTKFETRDGSEVDRFGDDLYCAPLSGRYLCASTPPLLKSFGDTLGKTGPGELAKRVAKLPPEYRGQAEIVIDVAGMVKVDSDFDTNFGGQLRNPKLGIASLRFGGGAVTARLWFQADALDKVAQAASVPSTLTRGLNHPASVLSMRIPMQPITAASARFGSPIPGIDLQKDVLGNLSGEIVAYTKNSEEFGGKILIGLRGNDTTALKSLLSMGCGMATLAGVPGLSTTAGEGSCTAVVDISKLPLTDPLFVSLFHAPLSIRINIKSDRIELSVGAPATNAALSESPIGQELRANAWNFAMWAEGISLGSGEDIALQPALAKLPPEIASKARLAIWILSHVYEFGFAGGVGDDGIHALLHVGTYAGDPPEAYQAYQAAITGLLGGQESGPETAKAFAAIREKWPTTMAGRRSPSAASTMVLTTFTIGVLAAISIPSFMKYQRRAARAGGESRPGKTSGR